MDTSRCPICGDSNACAMADPATAGGPCWCTAATLSDDVLDRVPEEARRKACVCPRCAQQGESTASEPELQPLHLGDVPLNN